MMLIYLMILII